MTGDLILRLGMGFTLIPLEHNSTNVHFNRNSQTTRLDAGLVIESTEIAVDLGAST